MPAPARRSHHSKGASAYGGHPDIDELFHQQARERDSASARGDPHRIQQLTVERVSSLRSWTCAR